MRKDASLKFKQAQPRAKKTRIQIDSWIKTEIKLQSTFREQLWQFEYLHSMLGDLWNY